uniref:Odorant receptor n=1 Tax=Apolygus lucorum TaxID=248454 RepID=A0A0U2EYW5_APOLU|nr:olfactory receptor 12 [Apolygus lucorum]
MKFIDKLAEEEDDELIEILKGNYWHFLFYSMTFIRWKRPRIAIALISAYAIWIIVHLVIGIYSIYLAADERNWAVVGLVTHHMVLGALAIYLPIFCNTGGFREVMADMHRTFTTDIGQYSGGNMYAEQACIDIKKDVRRQTFVYYINPALVAAAGSLALAGPFLTKWFSGMENPYSPNGLSLKLPTALYYPFPTDSGVVFYAIVLTQVISGTILGYLILAPQLVFINLSQNLKRELRFVGYSMETLVRRAMRMTFENNVWKRKVTELDVDDTEFQQNVELSIKETIIHHQKASKLLSTAQVSVKGPLAASYIFGLVTIAISLYNITLALKTNDIGSLTTFLLLLSSEVIGTFINCGLIGSELTEQSEDVTEKLYFIEWYNFSVKNRKMFFTFQTAITQPYEIKAGGVTPMNMETFSDIMNSAYSFFNILQTIE